MFRERIRERKERRERKQEKMGELERERES